MTTHATTEQDLIVSLISDLALIKGELESMGISVGIEVGARWPEEQ
ncbi:hypothetical protein [Nocardioides piscis]|uniref:Uncharacterized protein n=1 Tax=Nocardioides piscis TaxID=2714938 RepID=A0A6G7YBQ4_9ACTN|nr:hypothetical protein [Nocardioides piscis]QIK74106.1 hypothetical protein G7071_00290 [Nocardioides piscis]